MNGSNTLWSVGASALIYTVNVGVFAAAAADTTATAAATAPLGRVLRLFTLYDAAAAAVGAAAAATTATSTRLVLLITAHIVVSFRVNSTSFFFSRFAILPFLPALPFPVLSVIGLRSFW